MSDAAGERFRRSAALFEELVELSADERSARLDLVGRSDLDLRREVEALLAADGATGALLAAPAAAVAGELLRDWLDAENDLAGKSVGPFRLVRRLGRGGMGEVWEAEREDGQYEQTVALKLLKRGMDSEAVVQRFLRERQILARLAHPGIARLLDGGVAPDGRPFLVLEKVDGEPITRFAARSALAIAARLRLMIDACGAVDAAHRQLVVHRDLKPSNVLVTGAGEVKLLDFGIAKLLDDEPGDTVLTRLGERALTPAYAAPEQILGTPVSTATDVYALGLLLCELLTGRLPHDRAGLDATTLAARVQLESTPRLPTMARRLTPDELERLALPPREGQTLGRRLAGDLETIVARALDRDPARRYASAAALAEDLLRHLDGRPVLARPDTGLYRARRFVARHRVGVGAATVAALSLMVGLGAAIWQARRASAAALESAANARRAESTRDFLISLFAVADPLQSGGRSVTAGELLDQGAQRLESELADEPEVRADLLEAVARIETSLGLLAEAEASAGKARALRRPDDVVALARADAALGGIRLQQGNLDEAERLLDGAVAALEAGGAAVPPLVLARARSDQGQVRFWRKRSEAALATERAVLATFERELGPEHVETALHRRNVGVILDDLGRLDEAEAEVRAAQAVLEKSFGPEHPNVAQGYLDLGAILFKRGERDAAIALVRRTLEIRRRTLGDTHVRTGQAWQNLAFYLEAAERYDESESATRAALAIFRAVNPDGFEVGKCLNTLSSTLLKRGDLAGAETTQREAIANFERSLGADHPFTWWAHGSLSTVLRRAGRFDEAEALQRRTLAELERISGAESSDAQWGHQLLAETYRDAGRIAEAEAEATRAEAIAARLAGK